MLIASDILPVLTLVSGFNAASTEDVNGPFYAGSISGLKVFVSPDIEDGNYVLGVANPVQKGTAGLFAPLESQIYNI